MKYLAKTKRLSKVKFLKDEVKGFKITPKIKDFDVTEIVLFNKDMISYYVEKNFLLKFKKLLEYMQSDDDESGEYVLSQLDAFEWIILNEYKNFLSIDEIKSMLKDIYFLKQKLISKTQVFGKSR